MDTKGHWEEKHVKFIPALVVAFIALATGGGAVMPLLAAAEGVLQDQPQRTSAY